MADILREVGRDEDVVRAADAAMRAILDLNRAIEDHPDAEAAAQTILTEEARDSAAIEGLFGDEDVATCRRAIVAGREAMVDLPVGRRLAEVVCSEVLGAPTEVRTVKLVIQLTDGTVIYRPPSGQGLLLELMADWDQAMNREWVHPLVQVAVGHAQFEAIHPFVDGNGRTGRALVLLQMLREGLLSAPALPVSFKLRWSRPDYYQGLSEYRSKAAWAPWACFMLGAISRGAAVTRDLLGEGRRPTGPRR